MAASLIPEAEKAEEVGSVFSLFIKALPDRATEVTGLISECFAISMTLQKINALAALPECKPNYNYVRNDLDLVQRSLFRTFETILHILGNIGDGRYRLTSDAYQKTWRRIQAQFRRGGQTLLMRLESYRTVLLELDGFIRNPIAAMGPGIANIRKLHHKLRVMDDPEDLTDHFQGLGLDTSGLYRQSKALMDLTISRSSDGPISVI